MNICFPEDQWIALQEAMRDRRDESAAIALAHVVRGATPRLLVRELRLPTAESYQRRGAHEAELSPQFVADVVREARDAGMSTVFIHTHPFAAHGEFSPVDDAGEVHLLDFVQRRLPNGEHAAIVLGRQTHSARRLGTRERATTTVIGPSISTVTDGTDSVSQPSAARAEVFDRQVLAFGESVQRRLARMRVGIVGLGGTGSVMAEQLAHLGVTDFTLVDPDVLTLSNLNRVVGATNADVDVAKVDISSRLIRRIRPDARVEGVKGSVLRNDVLSRLRDLDVLFCCTDSHGSRYVLNELAYRFLVPTFDCGVVIVATPSGVTHVLARIQMLAPGLACLTCGTALDPEQVRRDLLSDYERAQDPYVRGASVDQPAVISLNGTAVSMTVTMFLGAISAFPIRARHQHYDALRGIVRVIDSTPRAGCITCSREGGLAVGDSWPLPARSG